METWLMQAQSLFIVLLMIVGIINRKRRNMHVKIMGTAIVWDVILILQIELNRSAILKASKAMTNSSALNIHVTIAVLTVVLYGFMIHSGRKILANQIELKKRHRMLGWTTLTMRILTFLTSFWAVSPKV
jgi:uncharacterized membrane protein YozB (DUF420 family)